MNTDDLPDEQRRMKEQARAARWILRCLRKERQGYEKEPPFFDPPNPGGWNTFTARAWQYGIESNLIARALQESEHCTPVQQQRIRDEIEALRNFVSAQVAADEKKYAKKS